MITRNVAIKCCIQQLLAGRFVQTAEGIQYYFSEKRPVGRINLVAVVVGKEELGKVTAVFLDDGTGQITARLFEEPIIKSTLPIGETLLIVGKVRLFSQERYLSPEIIKPLDRRWIAVRKKELENTVPMKYEEVKHEEELIEPGEEMDFTLPRRKILEIIKTLDGGNGVPIEEIIQQCPFSGGEQIIRSLQNQGIIFEIIPGKVKIL